MLRCLWYSEGTQDDGSKLEKELPPVGVLTGPQHIPEFMLHSPHFFSVSRPEHPLLLVKKSFQVTGNPQLFVREAAYSPGWHGGVFTEPDVFCDAVSHAEAGTYTPIIMADVNFQGK